MQFDDMRSLTLSAKITSHSLSIVERAPMIEEGSFVGNFGCSYLTGNISVF